MLIAYQDIFNKCDIQLLIRSKNVQWCAGYFAELSASKITNDVYNNSVGYSSKLSFEFLQHWHFNRPTDVWAHD